MFKFSSFCEHILKYGSNRPYFIENDFKDEELTNHIRFFFAFLIFCNFFFFLCNLINYFFFSHFMRNTAKRTENLKNTHTHTKQKKKVYTRFGGQTNHIHLFVAFAVSKNMKRMVLKPMI